MENLVRILIVDDDADDRKLFIDAIKEVDFGIKCVTAKDGREALEILNNAGDLPDYIFLDLRMPGYNGKNCLFEIKNDQRLKDIPVIVYTTSRELEDSAEMKSLGAAHFISKPSNPDDIYYVVAQVLEEELFRSSKK